MTRSKVLAAIDVGSSKVAVLIGQQNEGNERINVLGASSVPSLGIRKGQIVNIEEASEVIIKAVEAAERMAGLSVGKILVSVGGAHIASQNSHGVVAIANPEGEIVHEDIKRAIEAARAISLPSSREVLHVIPRTYTVDSQQGVADPIGMSGVRLEVETHIITSSTTAVKNLSKCIAEVGADIGGLVFSGIASAQAVLTETEKELGVILLDIGGGTTSMIVFIENAPSYTSVLPIGAKNVTNDLAIGLRLSLDGAEKLKVALSEKKEEILAEKSENQKVDEIDLAKLGIFEETKTISQKTLVEGIIRPRLNEIFGMVAVEIQKSGFAGFTPSGVVLTGGGALTVGATESCRSSLSLPVRVGIPSEISGLVDDILNPAFSVAIGLLFYGFKGTGEKFSGVFLPKFGEVSRKISVKGLLGKVGSFVRSFLP